MNRSALAALILLVFAAPGHADVLLARAKGSQVDEAVGAFKAEWRDPVQEIVIDDDTDVTALTERLGGDRPIVVGIGARAAQLALKQAGAPVVHCMVLQGAKALDGERSVGVPLAVPAAAQLRSIRLLAPGTKSVGIVYDPKLSGALVDEARAAGRQVGIVIDARAVDSAKDAAGAMDALLGRVDAVLLIPDATVVTKELLGFVALRSIEKRVPVFGYSEALVKLGLFAALAPSYAQNGKLCAQLTRRVQAGEAPAKLHNLVQMQGTLTINVGVARRIGLAIPPDLLKSPTVLVGQ